MKLTVLLTALVLVCSSCSSTHSVSQGAVVGGAGGAAVGAGTGALVGSLIAHGDVGASALLGTGIGLPVGAAVGAWYISDQNNAILRENQEIIEMQSGLILEREAEVDQLRQDIVRDSYAIDPNVDQVEHIYLGPTLGNPKR